MSQFTQVLLLMLPYILAFAEITRCILYIICFLIIICYLAMIFNDGANNAEREDDEDSDNGEDDEDDNEWEVDDESEEDGEEHDEDEEDDELVFGHMDLPLRVLDALPLIYHNMRFLHFLDRWFVMYLTSWVTVISAFWYFFALIPCTVVAALVILLIQTMMGM